MKTRSLEGDPPSPPASPSASAAPLGMEPGPVAGGHRRTECGGGAVSSPVSTETVAIHVGCHGLGSGCGTRTQGTGRQTLDGWGGLWVCRDHGETEGGGCRVLGAAGSPDVPPTPDGRPACHLRPPKACPWRQHASTSAPTGPWRPPQAEGSLGRAAGRAAVCPMEGPGGKVPPRRLWDHLPGSGGFYWARLNAGDRADAARRERRGAGRLCFLEVSSKRRARGPRRADLGRSRAGVCVCSRPSTWARGEGYIL